MTYAAYLWGGACYAWPEDPEFFESLAAIRDAYARRCHDHSYPVWGDVHVNQAAEMAERGRYTVGHIHLMHNDQWGEYPDYVLYVGARGAVRTEKC